MTSDVMGLAGARALVVGGGAGMGRSTSLLLARCGARVVVADHDADAASRVAGEIADLGGEATPTDADVTDEREATGVVDRAVEVLGGLDVVVNIVGLAEWGDLFDTDDARWDRQFDINVRHHLYVGRAAARHMIDAGTRGRMAFVASVSGLYGAPRHGAYGAAKAALMGLVRTMSQEWGPHGIRVNAVAPDMIATPRVRAGFEGHGTDMAATARAERVSLGRFGEPEEIAGPLVFLVSDLAGFVTGQTIVVDGGVRAAFPHAGVDPFR